MTKLCIVCGVEFKLKVGKGYTKQKKDKFYSAHNSGLVAQTV